MKQLLFFILLLISFKIGSLEFGGGMSTDYYNNPIEDSAPSPIQQRPFLFHNLNIAIFNMQSGFGILESYYEIGDEQPVFNDMYSGFYTLEFDLFTYPGLLFNITDKISFGLGVGGGVRLPILTKVDDGVTEEDAKKSMEWFYADTHFLFWGAQAFTHLKLPLSDSLKFFGNFYYKRFLYREDQWIIGAGVGILWFL